jgi:uncharacterized Rossmann fold enzyme
LFLASAEEAEVSFHREQAEKLRRRLNDLEDGHDELTRVAEVAIAVVGPGLQLLPDRLRALPRRVQEAVCAGARQGAARALATADIQVDCPLADLQPEWPLPPDQHRHYVLHFPIVADAAAAGVDIDGVLRDSAAADIGGL